MDAAPNIPVFRTMLEGIVFAISADTDISNQEDINQFSGLKVLSDDRQGMWQAKHLIAVVHKPIVGQGGHVINSCAR